MKQVLLCQKRPETGAQKAPKKRNRRKGAKTASRPIKKVWVIPRHQRREIPSEGGPKRPPKDA